LPSEDTTPPVTKIRGVMESGPLEIAILATSGVACESDRTRAAR
jgi:hypothetical protein